MKVGFYDKKKHAMVDVEVWTDGIELARASSVHMAGIYKTGKHRMPSPIWCVWDETEHASIFFLDQKPSSDQVLMNSILALMV